MPTVWAPPGQAGSFLLAANALTEMAADDDDLALAEQLQLEEALRASAEMAGLPAELAVGNGVQTAPHAADALRAQAGELRKRDADVISISSDEDGDPLDCIIDPNSGLETYAKTEAEIHAEPRGRHKAPDGAQHRCGICFDHFRQLPVPHDFLAPRPTSSSSAPHHGGFLLPCSHPLCHGCTREYLGCAFLFSPEWIPRAVLTQEEHARFGIRHIEASLGSRAAYCPNKRCGTVLEMPEGAEVWDRAQCPGCGTVMCPSCRVEYHENLTCEQFRAIPEHLRNREDMELLDVAAQRRWRRCPGCSAVMELDSGCNHITCKCKKEFCYICGADWTQPSCRNGCALWDERNLLDEQNRQAALEDQEAPPAGGLDRIEWEAAVPARRPPLTDLSDLLDGYAAVRIPAWLYDDVRDTMYSYCGRRFDSLPALRSHLANTWSHRVYVCCGRVFLDAEGVWKHRQMSARHN
ncbi:hypothetical protein DFJ74DRAFT_759998 [Hyaloraphidium curvatum]|nr:hypothetical protein DFJ74DRAFT_759998 [Hyaloraphidium curvatum]